MNVGEVLGNVLKGKNRADEKRNVAAKETVAEPKYCEQLRESRTEELERKAEAGEAGLKLLAQCLRTLYDSDSFMKAIQQVTAMTGEYLNAEQSWCFWLKDEMVYNSFQWSSGEFPQVEISPEELGKLYFDLWDSLFDGREYVIIPDIGQTELLTGTLRERFEEIHTRSLILIPMFYKEQLLQMIVYHNVRTMPFGAEEFTDAMYCMLNMSISRVFERKKNFELTYYDTLTGLYNRTKFWKDMRNASEEERRNTGIVLVHMKHLKKVNEEQGHEAGNQMLKRFAVQIDEIMPGEIVYRIGGSDFVFWMQHLEQAEFVDKVMSLKEVLDAPGRSVANIAARWEEYAEDLYQLARQTDEDLYQELEVDERKTHFRK